MENIRYPKKADIIDSIGWLFVSFLSCLLLFSALNLRFPQ